jgi:hypothetical protein
VIDLREHVLDNVCCKPHAVSLAINPNDARSASRALFCAADSGVSAHVGIERS